MSSRRVYKEHELNHFKLLDIIQTVAKGLRKVFKREWYFHTGWYWLDRQIDRDELCKRLWIESTPNTNLNDLDKFRWKEIKYWDCTMVCNAIRHIPCPIEVFKATYRLKKIRNQFSHNPELYLSTYELHRNVELISGIFRFLNLSEISKEVEFIEREKTFSRRPPTPIQTFQVNLCKLPFPPSHEFTFREDEVEDVSNRLRKMQDSITNDAVSVLYIHGNAGSGKSQVARQFGNRLFESKKVKCVATLNAENKTTMIDSLGKLASDLGCDEGIVNSAMQSSGENKSLRSLSNSVRKRLKSYSSWLLIVENITKESDFSDFWPQPGEQTWGSGQVVVTTLDARTVPSKSTFTDSICLSSGMTKRDAENLLFIVSNVQGENFAEVIEALDRQPLALASAATYVKESGHSWNDYINKLREGKQESTDKLYRDKNYGSYKKTMTEAVFMSSRYLWNDDPVLKSAFTFLGFCALEQPVPLDLMVQYITRIGKQDDGVVTGKLKACTQLILGDMGEESSQKIVTRHQVIQRSFERLVHEGLAERSARFEVIADILTTFQVYYAETLQNEWDPSSVMKKKLYFQHLKKITDSIEEHGDDLIQLGRDIALGNSLEELGNFCRTYSKHATALIVYRFAIQLRKNAYGDHHLMVAAVQSKLADSLMHLGRSAEADKYCSEALAVLKVISANGNKEEVDVNIAETLTIRGLIQEKESNLTESKTALFQALDILNAHPSSDPEIKSLTLNSIGTICYRLGDFQGSYEYLKRAMELRRGKNNPKLSQSLCNLGFVASEINKLKEGEKYLEEAFTIAATKYDSDNDILAYIYCNKGIVFRRMGRLHEAKKYSLEACETFRRFGDDPIDIAEATDYLGMVYYERQEYADSRKCHEEAISAWTKKGNMKHPILGRFEGNLGAVLEATGELESALEHYNISLEIMKNCEEYHPKVAEALDRISSVNKKLGNAPAALDASNRAILTRNKLEAIIKDGNEMRKRSVNQSQPSLSSFKFTDEPDLKKKRSASTYVSVC